MRSAAYRSPNHGFGTQVAREDPVARDKHRRYYPRSLARPQVDQIRAALIQEEVDSEVIVVDDGSRDQTAVHLWDAIEMDVTVLDGGGRGPAHARNIGTAAATGDYIAYLDDDDAWSPRKLHDQMRVARNADADFVYSAAIVVNEDLEPVSLACPTLRRGFV